MKIVVLSVGLMMLFLLGTASSNPQPVENKIVPSIDLAAPASAPFCAAQTVVETSSVAQVPSFPFIGFCFSDCSHCLSANGLCPDGSVCTRTPQC
jgi:hypothetical protein